VRGVSRAPETFSACPARPDLTGFGGGLGLHCDDDDGGCNDDVRFGVLALALVTLL